jgi:hypothetical protein
MKLPRIKAEYKAHLLSFYQDILNPDSNFRNLILRGGFSKVCGLCYNLKSYLLLIKDEDFSGVAILNFQKELIHAFKNGADYCECYPFGGKRLYDITPNCLLNKERVKFINFAIKSLTPKKRKKSKKSID